jgi:hypothetical protein
MIKAICLDNQKIPELEIGEIYEVELIIDKISNKKGWLITIEDNSKSAHIFDYDYTLLLPKYCFISLAEWRKKQIQDILDD